MTTRVCSEWKTTVRPHSVPGSRTRLVALGREDDSIMAGMGKERCRRGNLALGGVKKLYEQDEEVIEKSVLEVPATRR